MEPPVVSITASITSSSALPALGLAPGLGLVPSPGHLLASAKRVPSPFGNSSVIIFLFFSACHFTSSIQSHGVWLVYYSESGVCRLRLPHLLAPRHRQAPKRVVRQRAKVKIPKVPPPSSYLTPLPLSFPVSLGSHSRLPHVLNCFPLELTYPISHVSSPPIVRVPQRASNARANPEVIGKPPNIAFDGSRFISIFDKSPTPTSKYALRPAKSSENIHPMNSVGSRLTIVPTYSDIISFPDRQTIWKQSRPSQHLSRTRPRVMPPRQQTGGNRVA